ncbi:MAG: DUF2384 domain-containing protein [Candidatus Omnitrophica bacterium]|nr:DUF2384 domain-containing protein [Candidatus Omnitrophota bacterium]
MASQLFDTVAKEDHLSLYENGKPKHSRIFKYLDFNKNDVAKATGVAKNSIRYDYRIPAEVRDRLKEWANLLNLVAGFFGGDEEKTVQWIMTPNPMLGDFSPRDMIRLGRYKKLIKFILTAIDENKA